jgi:hypothetical protein
MQEVIVIDGGKVVVSAFSVEDESSNEAILDAAHVSASIEGYMPTELDVFVKIGSPLATARAERLFASAMSEEEIARVKHQALLAEIDREHAGQVMLLHRILESDWDDISGLSLVGDYGREVSFIFAQERTDSGSGKAKEYVCVKHGIHIDTGHRISPQRICATVYPRCEKTGRPSFTRIFISRDYPYQNEDLEEYRVILNEVTAELVMKRVYALLAKCVMKAGVPAIK